MPPRQYAVSFFDNRFDATPKCESLTWCELCAMLTCHDLRSCKDGPLFSPVLYQDGARRGNSGVLSVSLAVLDFDGGCEWESLRQLVAGRAAILYSTHSHSQEQPKYRAVVPFCKPVEASEWPGVWPRLHEWAGGAPDLAAKDCARIFYLPSCPPERSLLSVVHATGGKCLDWTALPCTAPELPRAVNYNFTVPTELDKTRRYIEAALAGEVRKVMACPDKQKHRRILYSACAVAGFLWTGAITTEEIHAALFDAVAPRAIDKRNASQTIYKGIQYGAARPRPLP